MPRASTGVGRVSTSALAEFAQAGELGDAGLRVCHRVMWSQLRRLPILHDGRRCDDDLAWDFVGGFLAERGPRAITALLAEADDDPSFERQLTVMVRHWLVDQVRKTDRGSVLRRLKDLLVEEDGFETVPDSVPGAGRWRVAGTDGPPWGGRLDDLVAAAYTVPARAIRWVSEERRPPIAAREDLISILQTIAEAADFQSLDLHQLVAVIVRRFPATLDPEARSIDGDAQDVAWDGPAPEDLLVEREEGISAAGAAAEVFARLTPSERNLLPILDNVDAVRAQLGCGRSTAYNRVGKLKALLRELTADFDDPEQVVREVLALCTPR